MKLILSTNEGHEGLLKMDTQQDLAAYAQRLEMTNQELLKVREIALRAVKTKSEFLSNMSHELRTPLNSILGMSELLNETNLDPQQKGYLSILQRNGESLLRLIDDILSFSRLESGQLPIENESFELNSVLNRVVEMLKPLADHKNLELVLNSQIFEERTLVGDAKKLEQVLVNLVGNAIKFTVSGSITLTAYLQNSSKNEYHFSIQDTGIGISADKLGELFKRFSQADASITKSFGGSGLGLAISKQLVELMGGAIWVESQPQQGSTFHFTLPFTLSATTQSSTVKSNSNSKLNLDGLKFLLAEDSPDNTILIRAYLKDTGCQVDSVENGKLALEKFETESYDFILMDMQMPEMDGYSATQWIRLLEKKKKIRPYIIALTAFAMKEEVEKTLAAGCDMHLSKPITKTRLFDSLSIALESGIFKSRFQN